jgi:hypothetical protein
MPLYVVDVLLDYPANEIMDFHQQLCLIDQRFVQTNLKLYFIKVSFSISSVFDTIDRILGIPE